MRSKVTIYMNITDTPIGIHHSPEQDVEDSHREDTLACYFFTSSFSGNTNGSHRRNVSKFILTFIANACICSKQLANLRIHYSRKVKELSEKLEEASKPKLEDVLNRNKTLTSSMAPPSRVATTRLIQPVNFSLDLGVACLYFTLLCTFKRDY